MNIRPHHATNLSGDGNDSLLVEEIAAQLYRQEANDRTSWDKLGPTPCTFNPELTDNWLDE